MKNRYKRLFLICCFIPGLLCAQDMELKRERTFSATALYGYMNGATDLFLEYDVQKLTVRDIVYKGEEYTVEIYDMPTPEDAFGIYSLHVFKCNCADTLNSISCLSPYQFQAVAGNKYISVVFPSGTDAAQAHVGEIVRKFVPDYDKPVSFIPELLELENPVSGMLKYLRGPLSLSVTNFSFAKSLEDISYSGIWYMSGDAVKAYRVLLYLENPADVDKLRNMIPSDAILETGEDYIYMTGCKKEEIKEDAAGFGF